jgi:hypothetical protein
LRVHTEIAQLNDIVIWVTSGASQDDLNKLKAVEDKPDSEITDYAEIKELMDGFVRVIKWEVMGTPEGQDVVVTDPKQNRINEIFEGRLQDGFISRDPAHYGRQFKDRDLAYLGYFSRDEGNDKWIPLFYGKGMHFKGSQKQLEGIFDMSVVDRTSDEQITSFEQNKVPE